jgi:MFS family permease
MNSSDALNLVTAPDKDNDNVGIDDPSYYRLNEEETETIEETNFNSAQLQPAEKSKNINRVLVYVFLVYCSRSLWNQSVIAAYVYLLKSDDPKFVGILTCITGIAQLLSGFPAGVLADKYRRDTLLKASSAFGVVAATLTLIATQIDHFILLGVALSCWGFFWGVSATSLSALFADSISDGERSKYFTKRSICQTIGNSTGPLVGLIVFSYIGNEWTIEECKFVLAGGQFLSIPALIMLCTLNDDYAVSMIISYLNHAPTYLVCIFWVSRTAIMNSTSALTKSILMDAVPKNERAKWSSLENLNNFGWAGSAAVGGYLVDYEGIIFNFSLTVCFQLLATIPFLFLFGRVQREQQ